MPLFPYAASLLLSAGLATSGMLYELSLAQALSVIHGGTLLQYSLVIGLFTFALGLASLFYHRLPAGLRTRAGFAALQAATALLGGASVLLLEALFRAGPGAAAAWLWLSYLPPLLVGLLTGAELPLLLEGWGARERSACIGADYFGMFAATLAFPLVLLPLAGPASAAFVAAGLNLAAGALALRWSR